MPETVSVALSPAKAPFDERATIPFRKAPPGGEPLSTSMLGPYQLLEVVARGGMGVVHKARHTALGRIVALKTLRTDSLANQEHIQRFCREAQAASQLSHPNIVPIYDVGEQNGQHYYAMAFLPGGSLSEHREQFAGNPRAAAAVVEKIARAVHHAHEKGIFHRDLKPGNVLLDAQGEPLVSDFGLAKLWDTDVNLTQTGEVLGTPSYMAPEQAAGRNDQIGARTDVWALGVILYELLTGARPFTGQGREEIIRQILTADPPRPSSVRRPLNRSLETIVSKCLEKEPARRYPSAAALADDLGHWLRGEAIVARPEAWPARAWQRVRRRPFASVAVLLVASVAVGLPVGITLRDPDRPLKTIERELAAGRAVTLVDERGPPRWFRWAIGEDGNLSSESDQPIALSSFNFAHLELLRDPQCDRYLFRAEVQHQDEASGGEVGIYFARSQNRAAPGLEHWFCALSFGGDYREIGLHTERAWRQGDTWERARISFLGKSFVPALLPMPQPWHKLAVKVTPEKIEPFWEDGSLGDVSWAKVIGDAHEGFFVKRTDPEHARPPELLTRGGLGLYVFRGAASFRRVVLEPLSEEN